MKTWTFFSTANDITDVGKRKAILLSCCGPATYSLLRSLVSPETPGEKDYTCLVKILKDHFNPKTSKIVQRFKFNTRTRFPGSPLQRMWPNSGNLLATVILALLCFGC